MSNFGIRICADNERFWAYSGTSLLVVMSIQCNREYEGAQKPKQHSMLGVTIMETRRWSGSNGRDIISSILPVDTGCNEEVETSTIGLKKQKF